MKPKDFPDRDKWAMMPPKIEGKPSDEERKAFTAARLELQGWILRDFDKTMTPTVKAVGIFLLESVNSETLFCYPSYRTICETLSIGKEKTVQRAISALVARGWLYAWRTSRTDTYNYLFLKNEQKVSQIAEHLTSKRDAREEDRKRRDWTFMTTREIDLGRQMSTRERTKMSTKSFNGTHEVFSSIESGEFSLGEAPCAVASCGDDNNSPYEVPIDETDAENVLDQICHGYAVHHLVRGTLKDFLLHGTLTPSRAICLLGGREAA
ncbi:helix-turn-helix domain-containing protein [Rhizobium sophoriradicis]|uniref:helix-turn-helix domain-containing protein n=1 Tax=Rhizobium sophoriradicis TaxID=1535245 RepID=UPI000BBDC297|nr:helix-turn-helix domain-containing protein [Rhizobium sophoriradicis]PCK86362.1 helix-turn-helix domain-containing protein [Rhizobium sophoriradicis]